MSTFEDGLFRGHVNALYAAISSAESACNYAYSASMRITPAPCMIGELRSQAKKLERAAETLRCIAERADTPALSAAE